MNVFAEIAKSLVGKIQQSLDKGMVGDRGSPLLITKRYSALLAFIGFADTRLHSQHL